MYDGDGMAGGTWWGLFLKVCIDFYTVLIGWGKCEMYIFDHYHGSRLDVMVADCECDGLASQRMRQLPRSVYSEVNKRREKLLLFGTAVVLIPRLWWRKGAFEGKTCKFTQPLP